MAQSRIDAFFVDKARNKPSTDPKDILLNPAGDLIPKLDAAITMLNSPEYRVNQYLDFKGMDSIKPSLEAGKTILHLVIFHVSQSLFSEDVSRKLMDFFSLLNKKNEESDGRYIFQPNYPVMSPAKFTNDIDLHMISMKKIIKETEFVSKRLQRICKQGLEELHNYYSKAEFDDESGYSDDDADDVHEGRYAPRYKKHIKVLGRFVEEAIDSTPSKITAPVKGRILGKYGAKYSAVPRSLDFGSEDSAKWSCMWKRLNDGELLETDHKAISNFVVPLFHGVPLMQTQYTNHERRAIFDSVESINLKLMKKLKGEEVEFTAQEQALLRPHTRTALASAKLQSLYEMINATPEELRKLEKYENELLEYFRNHEFNEAFKKAMQIFIFGFGKDKTKDFWQKIKESVESGEYPSEDIIKYRFPIIATSKTPDHAFKFGIGSGIEEKRGEGQLDPWYNWQDKGVQEREGFPYHRFAGLIYVTLNDLEVLEAGFRDGTIIDVNQALSKGLIGGDVSESRFRSQLEVDFLGKMTGEVVAIIPIIYPHIRDDEMEPDYHEGIYGFHSVLRKNSVDNPQYLREELKKSAANGEYNPALGNNQTFGKMMAHTYVNMANGAVLSATKAKGSFACTIGEDNKLKPFNVHFDNETNSSKLSHAWRDIGPKPQASKDDPDRSWQKFLHSESRPRKRKSEDCSAENSDRHTKQPKKEEDYFGDMAAPNDLWPNIPDVLKEEITESNLMGLSE